MLSFSPSLGSLICKPNLKHLYFKTCRMRKCISTFRALVGPVSCMWLQDLLWWWFSRFISCFIISKRLPRGLHIFSKLWKGFVLSNTFDIYPLTKLDLYVSSMSLQDLLSHEVSCISFNAYELLLVILYSLIILHWIQRTPKICLGQRKVIWIVFLLDDNQNL